MTDLDDRLREHFSTVFLSEARLEAIEQLAADACGVDERSRKPAWYSISRLFPQHSRWRTAGVTVSIACCAALLATFMYMRGSVQERGERTMQEVAMNHGTRLTFEFESNSLAALDSSMQLLPFELTLPDRMGENVDVLGSRYCSLAGRLAAHVKFRDRKSGQPLSLFVTAVSDDLQQLDGSHGEVNGVDVALWREDGLFYAMAQHD